jgi:ubiquitin-like 1-activating enzyme E1 B
MADMWRSRAPPLPLDFDAIKDGTFILREPSIAQASSGTSKGMANGVVNSGTSGSKSTEKLLNGTNGTAAGLKDQRSLTLGDNLALFVSRYGHFNMSIIRETDILG